MWTQEEATLPRMTQPQLTQVVLVVTDFVVVTVSLLMAVALRYFWDNSVLWDIYLDLWPMLLLFPLVYALAGLYGVGIAPPEELRRLSYSTSLVFLVLSGATFMYQAGADYSRGAFVFAWALALLLVPLGRALMRHLLGHKTWWGAPVLVLGAGQTGAEVVRALRRQPGMGLRPVALLDDDPGKFNQVFEGVQVKGPLEQAVRYAKSKVKHAIMAMPGVPRGRLLELLETHGNLFPHLIIVPDLFGLSSLWVTSKDMGGVLGLEVKQKLLLPQPKLVKRLLDIGLVLIASPFILLLGLFIMLWIRLDSPGPVIFSQLRPGKDGRSFRIYKFRTMYKDAESRLKNLPPALLEEFRLYGKIQNDPRITGAGIWLRRLSLDEFPQFWNVLRGDMSLVGPRAYLFEQVDQIDNRKRLIFSVLPGLTGLWQVSGRSNTTQAERVEMDAYYVRNWSPWLDVYILARTVWVVLAGKGAY